jgi:NIMA-interacting peptidyl-prolyl cis-trans isomerase 1
MNKRPLDLPNTSANMGGRALILLSLCLAPLGGCVVSSYDPPGTAPRIAAAPPPVEARDSAATKAGPESIVARHLLIQYRGAMRSPEVVTRTKEEARQRADAALVRARSGEDFNKLVAEFSDEPGAAERNGSLGRIPRDAVVPAFGDAAFALQPGEMSDVVESPFGFHLIVRDE